MSALVLCLAVGASSTPDSDYLEANAKKEGVHVLPSGLQYRVIASGKGNRSPKVSDQCVTHYHGTLVDGTVFDSSRERNTPITFSPNRVISGWREALQLMREGDRWELAVPASLGYGASGVGKIPGGSTLIFDIELLEVHETRGWFTTLLGPTAGGFLDQQLIELPIVGSVSVGMAAILLLVLVVRSRGGGGGSKVSASHILVGSSEQCAERQQLGKNGTPHPPTYESMSTRLERGRNLTGLC